MKNIVENNNVKVELGQIMQDALHERALIMHTLPVLKAPFLQDDEFVIVLEALNYGHLIQFTEKLVMTMNPPFLLAGHEINVGISMGISSYPEHGHDCATLINRADIAMYEAKRKNIPYVYYTDKIKKKTNLNLVRA